MTRTWCITGSSAGFGQALASAALAAGDNVVATARRPQTLESLVGQAPERTLALAVDVTDHDQIDAPVTAATELRRTDVLVNNAGLASGRRRRRTRQTLRWLGQAASDSSKQTAKASTPTSWQSDSQAPSLPAPQDS